MFKKILKFFFFVFVVLAIGQIPAFDSTLGDQFVKLVKNASVKSWEAISKTKFLASLNLPSFGSGVVKESVKATHKVEKKISEKFSKKDSRPVLQEAQEMMNREEGLNREEVSDTDRQAMLRILEKESP